MVKTILYTNCINYLVLSCNNSANLNSAMNIVTVLIVLYLNLNIYFVYSFIEAQQLYHKT